MQKQICCRCSKCRMYDNFWATKRILVYRVLPDGVETLTRCKQCRIAKQPKPVALKPVVGIVSFAFFFLDLNILKSNGLWLLSSFLAIRGFHEPCATIAGRVFTVVVTSHVEFFISWLTNALHTEWKKMRPDPNAQPPNSGPVSYTHLTLPTILLV